MNDDEDTDEEYKRTKEQYVAELKQAKFSSDYGEIYDRIMMKSQRPNDVELGFGEWCAIVIILISMGYATWNLVGFMMGV